MDNFKKYPRTFHLPWSLGATSDDKTLSSVDCFKGQRVVVTLKMDGENTTLYHNGLHARSLDYSYHESRSWMQNKHGEISHRIPKNLRICGENLFAKHAIHYQDLENYFMVFSVWEGDKCLSWEETKRISSQLELMTVPVIFEGVFDEKAIKAAFKPFEKAHEGYVVRLADSFQYNDFSKSLAKFVRANHVAEGSEHWKHQQVVKNKIKAKDEA